MSQTNAFGTREYSPTVADTHARVQLTNTHPNHREEIHNQLDNKGYVMAVAHQDHTGDAIRVKFDKRNGEDDGEIVHVHPKWLTVLDDPQQPDDRANVTSVETLTPGYYVLTTRSSYPRFVHVHDDNTCSVTSTVTTLEETEYSTTYIESWLNRWNAQPVRKEDTPFTD